MANFADNPVFENDLHARHVFLVGQKESLPAKLEGDADFYDAKLAGWWCWGICCWIGSGFCSGDGPWTVKGGRLVKTEDSGGVCRSSIHLGDFGKGVNRKRQRLSGFAETGVNASDNLTEWFDALSARLRRVRVCCGDWSRICGPSVTIKHGGTAVFLDPPYADTAGRTDDLYRHDSLTVAHDVREWAIAQGGDPLMRIALCGYEGEHEMPEDWECVAWKRNGGYGSQGGENATAAKERIWFSPHCLKPHADLFAGLPGLALNGKETQP